MGADQSSPSKNGREQRKYNQDEINRLLEQQRKLFDQKLARERMSQNTTGNAQQTTSIPLERNSTSYSFTGEQLRSGLATTSSAYNSNLYPNLNEASGSSVGISPKSNEKTPHHDCGTLSSGISKGNPSEYFNSGSLSSARSPRVTSNETTSSGGQRFSPSAPPAPRDRSISRNRNSRPLNVARKNNEDDELNCPTCKDRYTLTIFQCQRGHSSCVNCKNRSACCGVCGLPITNMRNITLEAYICERKIHCPNSDDGCNWLIKLADMQNHLKECPFREMQCPLAAIFRQCQWRGKLPQMASHFDDVHQMHRQANVDTEMRLLNSTQDKHIVYYVVIGTFNFLFHAKVSEQDGMMYMAVQLMGTQHSAAKWSYGIHIYNKAEPRRKYEYSDICNSINTPINTIFTISKCAAIPLSYAKSFENNFYITYKFFIKKEFEGRDKNSGNNHRGRGGARRRNQSKNGN